MLKKRIIPCLDVKDGRVVKGVNFVELRDAGDPVEIAKRYSDEGADEITFLDITASSDNRDTILHIVEETARQVFVPLTVGGGVRTTQNIRETLLAGADKVALNTTAIKNPKIIQEGSEQFGKQCIVIAIDAKRSSNTPSGFEVFTHGGRNATGLDALAWAKKADELGAGEILLTSMDADGTKAGYDLELTRLISENVAIPVIASGGAGNLEHLQEAFEAGKADAVLAASIFHYGEHSLHEAKTFLQNRGIPVRNA